MNVTWARRTTAAAAVLAVTAVLAGCEDSGGGAGGDTGGAGKHPTTYGKDDTRIEAAPGERVTIKLAENPSTGYQWAFGTPRPDAGVLRRKGERYEADSEKLDGGGGTKFFDFRAKAPGRTRIELRHCYRCGTPEETIDENHEVTELTFRVTVQK